MVENSALVLTGGYVDLTEITTDVPSSLTPQVRIDDNELFRKGGYCSIYLANIILCYNKLTL